MVSYRLDPRRFAGLAEASLTVALLTLGYAPTHAVAAEEDAQIIHQDLTCWPSDQYVILRTEVRPGTDVQKTLAYFRWERHAAWYFVPMVQNASGVWQAVMPKSAPTTSGVVYFLETISSSYQSTRTAEVRVPVKPRNQCADEPSGIIYAGSDPNITVGAVSGAPVPPGFQPTGIGNFISPLGITSGSGGGGGMGAGTLALIGTGGAGAVAGAVLLGGGGDSTGTSTIGPGTGGGGTTTAGVTTTVGGGGGSTTSSIGGSSSTTSMGGSSSSSSSTSSAASTSSSTTTAPSGADLELTVSSPGSAPVSSPGCSPVCNPFVWNFTIRNLSSTDATGVILVINWTPSGSVHFVTATGCTLTSCSLGTVAGGTTRDVTITVYATAVGTLSNTATVSSPTPDPNLGNNTGGSSTNITSSLRAPPSVTSLPFRSTLDLPPPSGRVRAQMVFNGSGFVETSNGGVRVHRIDVERGVVTAEANVVLGAADDGTWGFDFRAAPGFVPGSLRIDAGHVAALEDRSVVFALAGGRPARLRFTFEVSAKSDGRR